MNTKMILEVAGAKPLATRANTAGSGEAGKAKGLVVEKRPVALRENFASFGKVAKAKVEFGDAESAAQPTEVGKVVPGLGMGMWKGVFGEVVI